MKLKAGWKGHLVVRDNGDVFWDGVFRGRVTSDYQEGATGYFGDVTNTVWYSGDGKVYKTQSHAIESLLPEKH